MKVFTKILLFVLLPILFTGCKADLKVTSLEVDWDAVDKKAEARIENVGYKDAGMFMVYFNAEEDPVSPNHRPQVSHTVDGLAKGDHIDLEADFAPLAHPDNANLANVYKIVVIADPKDMVDELKEDNNTREKLVP